MSEGNSISENQNARKYKVLMVHNYYQIPGGEDTVVVNEKKLLEDNGHEVVLYTRNNSELKEMGKLKKLLLPITTVFNLRTYREVRKLIKEQHIDIVHVHNTLNLVSPAVYYAALSMKTPVVQTVHNFRLLCPGATFYRDGHICEDCVEHGLKCAVKHSCYRGSKLQTLACVISTKIHRMTGVYGKINYICLTEFNKERLLTLKQIKPERVFIKPNFTYNSDPKIIAGAKVSDADRKNQFVYVGRLDQLKGIEILFNAWKLLERNKIDYQLIVCGTGPMEDWCREFIEDNDLKTIEMMGLVPNEKARDIIAASMALILPTQWYEGFPMTLAEAYSVGTPMIVSDLGNAGSQVEDGVTGFKFQHYSPEALAEAVEKMNTSDMNMMEENVRGRYQCEFTQDANYQKLISIYKAVVAG